MYFNDCVIGITGQITPRKGQLELIKTFTQTGKKCRLQPLLVVGAPIVNQDELYLEKIKKAAQDLAL